MSRWMVLLFVGTALGAQEPELPAARVALGAFTDRYSDEAGTWKGWSLTGEWFRNDRGPWVLSVVGTERPEGKGAFFTVGKEHAFGESSWVWASLGVGTGADFEPSFRGDVDLNLGVVGGWSLGLEGASTRFPDGATTTLFQAGPAWQGANWSASARFQQARYLPGRSVDTGYLADLRLGTDNLRRWHSLRVAWGHGVIDALQPTGSTSMGSFSGGGGRGFGPGSGAATASTSALLPRASELLVSTSSLFPITKRFALRGDLAWGQKASQFTLWSASLQMLVTF